MEELDSAVVRNLADRVATGKLSITAASQIMEEVVKEDGVSKADVTRFGVLSLQASAKQMASSKRERNFWKWIRLPISIYDVHIPVSVDARRSATSSDAFETIAMCLPSDFLQAVSDAGTEVAWTIAFSFRSWT